MRKYLLKPLQCHYDNAHGEMTLKAKRGGNKGLHNNITSWVAVAQEVEWVVY